MVIDQHIYKCDVWISLTDKSVSASMQEDNKCDESTVNERLCNCEFLSLLNSS